MPIIKEIKNVSEIRQTLLKYPGKVSEATIEAAVKRYEQLQKKYDIVEPEPTDEDVIAEIAKDYENAKPLDENDAIPFYKNNFNIFVADSRKRWPGKYDGNEGEKKLRETLDSRKLRNTAAMKDLYIKSRTDELTKWEEYDAQEERKLDAAKDFFKWAGIYPTEKELEHIADICRGTPFYGGISDLTDYSDTLLDYRKRNDGILNELRENFVLDAKDLAHLSEIADKEKEKIRHHEKKLMREQHKPVFGDEPEIREHHNKIIEKMYARARNMHDAKIEKSYLHAIEQLALQTDIRKKMIYDVVNMQSKKEHPTIINAYIGSFDQRRETPAAEPKPITRMMKIKAYNQTQADEKASENRKKLLNGLSDDSKVPVNYIENLLKRLEPLSTRECERIGNEYYLLKDMNHQTGHAIIKQAIDRIAHERREARIIQSIIRTVENAQMFT